MGKKRKRREVPERARSLFPVNSYLSHGRVKRRHAVKGYGDIEPGSLVVVRYHPRAKKWVRDQIGHRAEVKEVYYTVGRDGRRHYGMVVAILEGLLRGFWFRVDYKKRGC